MVEVTPPAGSRLSDRVAPVGAALAVIVLLAALWAGLIRLGLPVPGLDRGFAETHGPVMTLGFLGTVVALERAVALRRWWAFMAPLAAGAGGLAVLLTVPDRIGEFLFTVAGLVLVSAYGTIHRIQPSWHARVMAVGAGCWVVAAVLLTLGWDISRTVPWLAGFLVLTIAGERLELTRFLAAVPPAPWWFALSIAGLLSGLTLSLDNPAVGVRVAGAGLLALAGWLGVHDIARRTVHARGVTRYMAVALLAGYAWLATAGGLWLLVGRMADGPAYDAMLHALFLGFVMSMVLAHAPVVVPAVLGRPLPYHPRMYAPLLLLHASLALRLVVGDAAGMRPAWQAGGVLNEIALLWVLLTVVASLRAPAPAPATLVSAEQENHQRPATQRGEAGQPTRQ